MKTCTWCGRENSDDRIQCLECGTELAGEAPDPKPTEPHDRSWIKGACGYIGATLALVLFYFLSFGPVTRFSVTVSRTPTTLTVAYPTWVAIMYYPALSLTDNASEGTVAGLYWRYLEWWQPPPTNN
jgi:hypothetical protein